MSRSSFLFLTKTFSKCYLVGTSAYELAQVQSQIWAKNSRHHPLHIFVAVEFQVLKCPPGSRRELQAILRTLNCAFRWDIVVESCSSRCVCFFHFQVLPSPVCKFSRRRAEASAGYFAGHFKKSKSSSSDPAVFRDIHTFFVPNYALIPFAGWIRVRKPQVVYVPLTVYPLMLFRN